MEVDSTSSEHCSMLSSLFVTAIGLHLSLACHALLSRIHYIPSSLTQDNKMHDASMMHKGIAEWPGRRMIGVSWHRGNWTLKPGQIFR